ncbi:MAG: hypothetical protein H0U72_09500 [Nitrosospira sp.]|nr:hypothetical protein [Nitrosospira sp.]
MSVPDLIDIKFTGWKWKENRFAPPTPVQVDRRCAEKKFQIDRRDLESYEENLKWESQLVSEALLETRKRKIFAINA